MLFDMTLQLDDETTREEAAIAVLKKVRELRYIREQAKVCPCCRAVLDKGELEAQEREALEDLINLDRILTAAGGTYSE